MENLSGRILLKEFQGNTFANPFQQVSNPLQLFSYATLDENMHLQLGACEQMCTALIPVTGDLIYSNGETAQQIEVGQVFLTNSIDSLTFELKNPFKDQKINFIYFQFKLEDLPVEATSLFGFELSNNNLINIAPSTLLPFRLHLGRLSGRTEINYTLDKSHAFFCFALAGAFEIQGRLIHPEDALALWDNDTIELEALSNDALIITIDFPYICL